MVFPFLRSVEFSKLVKKKSLSRLIGPVRRMVQQVLSDLLAGRQEIFLGAHMVIVVELK